MITLSVNGAEQRFGGDPEMPLLWYLRDHLGLTGTKFGCGIAMCGACTVHVNGMAVRSCVMPVGDAADSEITTIEAIGDTEEGARVQQAWIGLDVVQCGYCQPGQIMAATALLAVNPAPSNEDINAVMAGNICRCGTYQRIRAAIRQAAGLPAETREG